MFHIWDFHQPYVILLELSYQKELMVFRTYLNYCKIVKTKKHDYIYYEFYEQGGKQSILRKDGWKLVRLQVSNPSQTYEELYNIYHDPSESANVIKQYPKIAGRLRKALDRQRTENPNFNFINKNQNEN